ncbi:hypothetical protein KIW84_022468 [Lathyrus oleraceus]|uniref:Uncharacterized protein n=1 Tax=Pisum sativum TaxID=3888 RepID=A0A9D4YD79_PEA|nr:hypothetical protein KIW84_022468 [Pisum sativum]
MAYRIRQAQAQNGNMYELTEMQLPEGIKAISHIHLLCTSKTKLFCRKSGVHTGHGYGGQSPALCRREPSIRSLQPSSNDGLAVISHALACRWLDLTAMALHPELQPKPHPITNANKAASSVHHSSINLQASSESCYGSAYDDNE